MHAALQGAPGATERSSKLREQQPCRYILTLLPRNMAHNVPLTSSSAEAAKTSRRKRKRYAWASAQGLRRGEKTQQAAAACRTDEQLDPAERLRRQKQRQAQALALKLRAEGKDYRPPKKYKQASNDKPVQTQATQAHDAPTVKKSRNGSAKHRVQQTEQESYREETGSRPEEDVQVIIVPIFWNKKADEKVTVLAAAEEVQQQLQELGLAVGLDSTNADTPGQKYRYWEEKGVKVRIELGPRDAQKSQACLAISSTPGQVAKKSTFQIGAPLTEAVHKAVNTLGLTCKVTPAAEADVGQHDIDSKSTASKTQLQHQAANSTTQNAAAPVAKPDKAKAVTKAVKHSGDDMGDEFDIEVDAAEDEGSNKQKKKSSVASDLSPRQTPKIKSKKPRVVEF